MASCDKKTHDPTLELVKAVKLALKNHHTSRPYTVALCNWLNGFEDYNVNYTEKKRSRGMLYNTSASLKFTIPTKNGRGILVDMTEEGSDFKKHGAYEECHKALTLHLIRNCMSELDFENFLEEVLIYKTQMDIAENGKIDGPEEASREGNVILEVDELADKTKVLEVSSTEINKKLASTESPYDMIGNGYSMMNRWYPWQQVKITPETELLFSLRVPRDLYSESTSINLLPLKGFIYGDLDLEFKLVLNSAPFHAGRIIMGIFYCPQGYNSKYQKLTGVNVYKNDSEDNKEGSYDYRYDDVATEILSIKGMVQRPHVMLDLGCSSSASLLVKYNYNKSFVRLLDYADNNKVNPGVTGGYFVNLRAMMMTKLRTADDNPKEVNCTLYFRFVKANLTGMTKQHELKTQMDIVGSLLTNVVGGGGGDLLGTGMSLINGIERQLTRKGKVTTNRDKPSMQFSTSVVIPRPRNHFPNGSGLADPIIMGIDAKSLTTQFEDQGYGPTSYLEYAKIPGIVNIFEWTQGKAESAAGKTIFSQIVQPYAEYLEPTYGNAGESNLSTIDPVPIHIASNGFMYWGGTIVYEFDFIKTAYHKGSIMISISYGKDTDDKIGSNYEKIVDIQDTSKIKITVPFIYDTTARRTNNNSYICAWPQPGNWHPDSLPTYNRTKISLIVMNPLINVGSVSNTIDVLVWKYAGEDFFLGSPCQVNNFISYSPSSVDNERDIRDFPRALYPAEVITAQKYLDNLPKTQMDYQDFNSGLREDERMHTGDETNFKNLLRVPIRIIYNQEIKKGNSLQLPVIPLSVELQRFYVGAAGRLAMNHQSQITKMFRMWRGTLRYTIISHTNNPLYVTYLPPDGSWKKMERNKFFTDRIKTVAGKVVDTSKRLDMKGFFDNGVTDMTGTGNFTTIILPSINPSEQVEVPWNLPVNWALMNQDNLRKQQCYRDISYSNNGHLCFYADEGAKISIFLSVGDDFEMGAFCGLTDMVNISRGIRMDDGRYKTQMDFHKDETISDDDFTYYSCEEDQEEDNSGIKKVKRYIKPALFGFSYLVPQPLSAVIQGFVAAHTFADVEDKLEKSKMALTKVGNVAQTVGKCFSNEALNKLPDELLKTNYKLRESTLSKLDKTLDGCYEVAQKTSKFLGVVQGDFGVSDFFAWLRRTFSFVGEKIFGALKTLFQKMYDNIMNFNFSSFCKYFLESLSQFGIMTKEYLSRKTGQLLELLKRILKRFDYRNYKFETQSLTEQNELDSVSFDSNDYQTLIGILMGGLLTVFGNNNTGWQKTFSADSSGWVNSLMNIKFIQGSNSCLTFVKAIYNTVAKMTFKLIGYQDEEFKIRELLASSNGVLSEFTKNAQLFINNFNDEAIADPIEKSKFWITICNAYQIQACLTRIKGDSATVVLKSLCRDVIKKANENMSLFKATAVRYEPFVLCLHGASGIGKSFLTSQLSADFLKNLGLKMNNIDYRYNVSPGVDYWNLYNNQPIIIYDDWCNLVDTQSIRKEISELYQLKTSNVMNAPKAELSEKKTVVNPFAVILATNNPFPKTNALTNHTPLYRRRDMLVKVELKPGVDRSDPKVYDNYDHLLFGIHPDVTTDTENFKMLNFTEFRKEVLRRHTNYHNQEAANVKRRIQILSEALTEQALVHNDIADPFTLQARSLYEVDRKAELEGVVKSLPSEMLEFQVRNLIETISQNFNLIKTTNNSFIIEDKVNTIHSADIPETQLFGTLQKYFWSPCVKTYNTLHSYLTKWLNIGFHCSVCSKTALNSSVLMKCKKCDTQICGNCAHSTDNKPICECGAFLELFSPKFLDIIIGYIVYTASQVLAPSNWKTMLATQLVNFFYKFEPGVPMLLINFMLNLVSEKNGSGLSRPKTLGQVQMDVEVFPPRGYKIKPAMKDGNCLLTSLYFGLKEKNLVKVSLEKFIKATEKVESRGEKGWFDTDKHGKVISKKYNVRVHLIERIEINEEISWLNSIIDENKVSQEDYDMNAPYAREDIHIVNMGDNHFDAIIRDIKDEVVVPQVNADEPSNAFKLRPLVPKKTIEFADLEMPKPWWFEAKLSEIDNNVHCIHDKIAEIITEHQDFDIHEDKISFRDGSEWPLKRCNKECLLNSNNLQQLYNNYFDSHRLTMTEHLDLVRRGATEIDNDIVPKAFQPKWVQSVVTKAVQNFSWENSLPTFASKLLNLSGMTIVAGVVALLFSFCSKALSSAFSGAFSVYKYFLGSTQSNTERGSSRMRSNNRQQKRAQLNKFKTQGKLEDSEHYNNIRDKICQNYVFIKTDKVKKMIGLGLFGSKILIPKHYIPPLKEALDITIVFANAKHENLKLNPRNIYVEYFGEKDCAIISVSKAIYFADIRKFFYNEEDYNSFADIKGEIVVPNENNITCFNIRYKGIIDKYEAYDDYSEKVYSTEGGIEYDFEQRGACGSILLCKEKNRPIIGMHVAGHAGYQRGVGIRLQQKELQFNNPIQFADFPYEIDEEGLMDFGDDVNIEYLGKISPELTPFLPTKTNIENSLIDEYFETPNKVQPAILTAKDPRYIHKDASPLVYGVKKHGKPTIDFDEDLVQEASKFWIEDLLRFKWPFKHPVKIYDMKTATLGLPDCSDYYDWLPDSTSAGWPYNAIRREGSPLSTQKKNWMHYERDPTSQRPIDVVFDNQILEDVKRDMAYRRKGICAPIVFQDVLKDEKRPIEKLMKPGGTRVFSMSPVTASIVLRQYTLDLTSYLRKNRIENWIAVGINPDGPEWGKLVNRLRSYGDRIFSIDFTNFGPGLNVEVTYEFHKLMVAFYKKYIEIDECEENVMRTLIQELMYSTHLAGGTLYRTKAGSPSGAAITVEINSFTHLMYISLCWLIIGKALFLRNKVEFDHDDEIFEKRYEKLLNHLDELGIDYDIYADIKGNFEEFNQNVIGVVYGDDGIFSVKEAFKDIFNAKTIQLVLEAHGICATDSTKSEKITAYGSLTNMTFLKRGFTLHPKHRGEWLAPIDVNSVEECARWIHKSKTPEEMTMVNAKASLLLAYGHGKQYYDNWRIKLNKYLVQEGLAPIYLNWDNLDQMFYPDYYYGQNKKEISEYKEIINLFK